MNKAVRRILKSIVHTYGLEFTHSQRLCNAYLADLMPQFPEERHQLVAAVADGLPYQLLFTQTRQQRKDLALQFGQAHSIPAAQALQTADTWFYVLHDITPTQHRSRWLSLAAWRSYLGGIVTGAAVLLVGSSIAFYKKPEVNTLVERMAEPTMPPAAPQVATILPTSTQTTITVQTTPIPTSQLAELTFLLPQASAPYTDLDALDLGEIQPVLLLQNAQAINKHPPSRVFELLTQRAPEKEMAAKAPLNLLPMLAKLEPNKLPTKAKLSSQPAKQAATQSQAQTSDQPKTATKANRNEAKQLFTNTVQDMQTLTEQVLRLRKKQNEQQAITQLLNLTGDVFYREQLKELEQQQKQLNARIDHLSASYSSQVAKLCRLSATGWQSGELVQQGRDNNKLQQVVLQHWKQCKGFSNQQIKQQLLTRY